MQSPSKVAAIMIPFFAIIWYFLQSKLVPRSSQKATETQSKKILSAVRKIPVGSSHKGIEKQSKRHRGAVKKIPLAVKRYQARFDSVPFEAGAKPGARQPIPLSPFDDLLVEYHIEKNVAQERLRNIGTAKDQLPEWSMHLLVVHQDTKGLLGRMICAYGQGNKELEIRRSLRRIRRGLSILRLSSRTIASMVEIWDVLSSFRMSLFARCL